MNDTGLIDEQPTPEMIGERHNTTARIDRLSVAQGGDKSAADILVSGLRVICNRDKLAA